MAAKKSFEGVNQQYGQLDTHMAVVGKTPANDPVYNSTPGSMFKDPLTDAPDGYYRITINNVDYQVPIYLAQ